MKFELGEDHSHDYDFSFAAFDSVDEMHAVQQAAAWMTYLSCYQFAQSRNFALSATSPTELDDAIVKRASFSAHHHGERTTARTYSELAALMGRLINEYDYSGTLVDLDIVNDAETAALAIIGLCESERNDEGPRHVRLITVTDEVTRTAENIREDIEAAKYRPLAPISLDEYRRKRRKDPAA